MSATQDYVALEWIRGELANTLQNAQFALEAVAESPDDATSMRSCLSAIHQVHGTLKMVQLEGPSTMAAEMEQVAQSLMNNSVPELAVAQETLMQAILQLPAYLDRLHRDQNDSESNYLPIVNNLRIARGEERIPGTDSAATEAAGPDLSPLTTEPEDAVVNTFFEGNGEGNLPKIRARYQQTLGAILKKKDVRENLSTLGKLFTMLGRLCGESPMGNLSEIGLAIVEGIASGAIKLDNRSASSLRDIDGVIKLLADAGQDGLSAPIDQDLASNLIALIRDASKDTPRISAVKTRYASAAQEQEEVTLGPDDETISAVAKILIEEMASVIDKLDLYVRSQDRNLDDLIALRPNLEQISSTMVVLGDVEKQITVSEQIELINRIEASGEADEEVLLSMAQSLLQIEASLNTLVIDGEDGAKDSFANLDEAQAAVIRETRIGLATAKDAVIDFISSDFDHSKIEDLPGSLLALRGGLLIVNQVRAGDVLESAAKYASISLLANKSKPELEHMDDLADAVTSVDYFLERLLENAGDPYLQMLEVAEAAVEKLGYAVGVEVEALPVEEPSAEVMEEPSAEVIEEPEVLELEDSATAEIEEIELALEPEDEIELEIVEEVPVKEPLIEEQEDDATLEALDDEFELDTLEEVQVEPQAEALEDFELDTVDEVVDAEIEFESVEEPLVELEEELAELGVVVESTLDVADAPASASDDDAAIDDSVLEVELELDDLEVEEEPSAEVEEEPSAEVVEEPSAELVEESSAVAELIDLPVDEVDEDILPIFLEETEELLEELDQDILGWSEAGAPGKHLDGMLRQLHTIKGGARMAGIASLGEFAHNFETFLIGVQSKPVDYDDRFFALLNAQQDEITRRVEIYQKVGSGAASDAELESLRKAAIPSLEGPVVAATPLAAAEITQEAEEPVVAAVTGGDIIVDLSLDAVDEDVLPIFLEESDDLVEELESSIQSWSESPGDMDPLDVLLRNLHTLKGGARMAGLNSLGEYAHNFETFLIGIQQNPVELGDDFFGLLNRRENEVIRRVEIYKKLSVGAASDDELASLKSALEPSLEFEPVQPAEPAADVADESQGVDPQAPAADKAATANQEMVRVSADLLEELIGLAGESSITRGRVEQQITDFGELLEEMEETINRTRDQVRRLEIEAESRETLMRQGSDNDGSFDDLEMDRYTMLQAISRALNEGTSDMMDLKDTLGNRSRDAETLLHQQARISGELQEGLTRTRMVPFARLIPRLGRIVRQISGEVGKSVRFDAYNVEGELDRNVLERIVAPLEHMLRNAVDHGIENKEDRIAADKQEQGRISLRLSREGGYVVLTVSDDGGGIDVNAVRGKAIERGLIVEGQQVSDHEVMQFIMNAGFSTAQKLTQISGRGVGMDVVASEIKALSGSIMIDSTLGVGTEFTIRIPFTVSINRALMVVVKEETYAVPLNTIEGIVRVSPYELEAYYQPDAPMFEYAGQPYRLAYIGKMLEKGDDPNLTNPVAPLPVILARSGDHAVALQVDRVIGSREVVVKTLGSQFSEVGGISGATVLGDGSVVIILDCMALVRGFEAGIEKGVTIEAADSIQESTKNVRTVMIVDDSVTVRKVTSRLMERHGFEVATAKDGIDAMSQLQDIRPDVVLLDIEMPRMDGFEVLRSVRRDEALKDLPIIMITSRTGEKHKQQAMELGVNEYLGKPFQEASLLATIEEVLANAKTKPQPDE